MQIEFYKYQGTGNDFIMIDNRNYIFPKSDISLVKKLCNRKFGIGADGLILIELADGYDFNMIYFNADGSQSFCGNGSRCAVKFASFLGIIQNQANFLSTDGEHQAKILHKAIALNMHDVKEIEIGNNYYFLNTGSPHYVIFTDNAEKINVIDEGRKIRYNERFKNEGTNVNFASFYNNSVFVRTYERGVENETLSCGTGVTATAIAASLHYSLNSSVVMVNTLGGCLQVEFKKNKNDSFTEIQLIGPAETVFKGQIDI